MQSTPIRRRRSFYVKKLEQFDAFQKYERNVSNKTESGGLATLFISLVIFYLTFHELSQYTSVQQKYEFLVDQSRSHDHNLQINFDMTVNMNCSYVRADILDSSGESLKLGEESIQLIPVVWSTEGSENLHDAEDRRAKDAEDDVDVRRMISKVEGIRRAEWVLGAKKGAACRFKGSAHVNKVTGMLHITAKGYGYLSFDNKLPISGLNFTHRIDQLSFGHEYPGLENPLDHTMEFTHDHMTNFEYFVSVVPTIYVDSTGTIFDKILLTNQYAVTEFKSDITDRHSTHVLPGIFIKYNIEPISIRITETKRSFSHFLVRLCGIIGGVFVTTGIIVHVINFFKGVPQKIKEEKEEAIRQLNRRRSSFFETPAPMSGVYEPLPTINTAYFTPYENNSLTSARSPMYDEPDSAQSVTLPIQTLEHLAKDE